MAYSVYHNASGIFEDNEVKNIWGCVKEPKTDSMEWRCSDCVFNKLQCNNPQEIHDYTGDEGAGVFIYCGANTTVTQNYISSPRSVDSPDQCGIEVGR